MGKKIGMVALYYKTYNYGAQLQCYALQRVLTKLGYDAELIRFRWYNADLERFYRYAGRDNYARFDAFSSSIPHSKRIYTPSTIDECVEDYDIFTCGSDQIWGVGYSMPSYVLPQITLSFVPDNKLKIAYAASMGSSATDERTSSIIKQPLRRLDAVSVRETSAVPFISELAGEQAVCVLDPTMLLTAQEWDDIAVADKQDSDYIFMYNIGNNELLDERAMKMSEDTGCEVRSVSYTPGDSPGPAEFIGLIKRAKYVLTNSFHGTVFSILYNKDFLSFGLDNIESGLSKNVRMLDLLTQLGLSGRYISKSREMPEVKAIDYRPVKEKLEALRSESVNFLIQVLTADTKSSARLPSNSKVAFTDTKPPMRDYLKAIADGKSDKELAYERLLVEKEMEYEQISGELAREIWRNEIYCKFLKFQAFGLSLVHEPLIEGNVVIYGAGKIGRIACLCLEEKMLCFIDGHVADDKCLRYPVYKLGSNELKEAIEGCERITFLVTPVWDFDVIEMEILELFPNAKVVSVDKTVEKMWA